MAERIIYGKGSASVAELEDEIRAFCAAVSKDEKLRREIEDAEFDIGEVEQVDPAQIEIRQEGEGFTGAEIALVVAFAPTATHILNSLWDEVVVTWIRRRRGANAIGHEKERR